jgi:hypothetical protein
VARASSLTIASLLELDPLKVNPQLIMLYLYNRRMHRLKEPLETICQQQWLIAEMFKQ